MTAHRDGCPRRHNAEPPGRHDDCACGRAEVLAYEIREAGIRGGVAVDVNTSLTLAHRFLADPDDVLRALDAVDGESYRNVKVDAEAFHELEGQIERLADVIMFEFDGEPSREGGAVECAIRLLRDRDRLRTRVGELADELDAAVPEEYVDRHRVAARLRRALDGVDDDAVTVDEYGTVRAGDRVVGTMVPVDGDPETQHFVVEDREALLAALDRTTRPTREGIPLTDRQMAELRGDERCACGATFQPDKGGLRCVMGCTYQAARDGGRCGATHPDVHEPCHLEPGHAGFHEGSLGGQARKSWAAARCGAYHDEVGWCDRGRGHAGDHGRWTGAGGWAGWDRHHGTREVTVEWRNAAGSWTTISVPMLPDERSEGDTLARLRTLNPGVEIRLLPGDDAYGVVADALWGRMHELASEEAAVVAVDAVRGLLPHGDDLADLEKLAGELGPGNAAIAARVAAKLRRVVTG